MGMLEMKRNALLNVSKIEMPNLFNDINFKKGYITNTGSIDYAAAQEVYTYDYIESGDYIAIIKPNTNSNYWFALALYDNNEIFKSRTVNNNVTNSYDINIPDGKKGRVSFRTYGSAIIGLYRKEDLKMRTLDYGDIGE